MAGCRRVRRSSAGGRRGDGRPRPRPHGLGGAQRTAWSPVPIEVGVADGSYVEVRGELAEGEIIVTDALDKNERAEAKAKTKGGLF